MSLFSFCFFVGSDAQLVVPFLAHASVVSNKTNKTERKCASSHCVPLYARESLPVVALGGTGVVIAALAVPARGDDVLLEVRARRAAAAR